MQDGKQLKMANSTRDIAASRAERVRHSNAPTDQDSVFFDPSSACRTHLLYCGRARHEHDVCVWVLQKHLSSACDTRNSACRNTQELERSSHTTVCDPLASDQYLQ
jgi:hypothetical protein